MDVRSDNDGHESSEATSEEKMHKSPYEIQEEEEKKAYEKKKQNEMSDSIEESVEYWQENDDISPRMSDNKYTLQQVLGLGESFDVNMREMVLGGKHVGLLLLTGFAKDEILLEVLKRLTYLTPEQVSGHALKSYFECYIPHIQVERVEKMSAVINKVLTGMSAMFVEGDRSVIIMDTRSYPVRSPEEPSLERVVRGSRDGFTETLLTNVALVRRRIRDPGLKFEIMQVGRRSQTDVCVVYIDDIVDKVQVDSVREKIKRVNIDGIPAADKQLEEAIINKGWHPYPLVRYSERPDVTASHLMDGRVVVFVDTSPSVMILPTTFFDLCEHAEENRQTAFMGTYLRWVRFGGILISLFLLPLWLLMVIDPAIKPAGMEFIGPHENAQLPLILQFLLIEFGVDLLRMAAVHTPTPLASAMGLIAAILVGDIAVKTGYFVNEVVLYMAIAAIGMFATPSYELGLANRLVRLFLLVAVAIFKVPGFVVGTTFIIVALTLHRSYNSSYLWPFIPFNAKALGNFLFRLPLLENKKRPSINKTRDNTKMDSDPDGELQKSKKHK
ncbi:stage V sporulation protein AF [Paenibacillus sp. ov031]|nr:Spore germination protein B1 [Paenibacillus sp. AD87]SHN81993.1 stage V sporulation protein AF [Paenibacillus sp. ov031]